MKNQYHLALVWVIIIFSCTNREIRKIDGGYNYKIAKNTIDSNNYILPIYDVQNDSTGLDNSRIFMQAFHEPNISLEGSESPIIRLVLEIRGKTIRLVRIGQGQLIYKTHRSGSWYPKLDLGLLTKKEKQDYYCLEYNFGYNNRSLTSEMIRWYDSVGKLDPKLLSRHYFEELKRKATIGDKLDYKSDTIPFSNNQLNILMDSINALGFWRLKLFDTTICMDSFDNGGYTLEVNTKERYSMVQQTYGCGQREKFNQLCMFILSLTPFKEEYKL